MLLLQLIKPHLFVDKRTIIQIHVVTSFGLSQLQAAKEARYDKEAVMKFFQMVCIESLNSMVTFILDPLLIEYYMWYI